MGRRNDGLLDAVVDIAKVLPWWGNFILSGLIYIVGAYVIPNRMIAGDKTLFGIMKSFAPIVSLISIIIAIAFLVAGIVKLIMEKIQKHKLESQTGLESIKAMNWKDFELLVGEIYKAKGYSVDQHGGASPDGGIDLVLKKDGEKILVQCKHWKVYRVNVKIVRELYGVMVNEAASKAIVITSGDFTQDALDFVKDKPLTLVNGHDLAKMIAEVNAGQSKPQKKYSESDFMPPEITASSEIAQSPMCPKCRIPMVLRTAKSGTHAGNRFWGCKNYPKCTHIEQIVS